MAIALTVQRARRSVSANRALIFLGYRMVIDKHISYRIGNPGLSRRFAAYGPVAGAGIDKKQTASAEFGHHDFDTACIPGETAAHVIVNADIPPSKLPNSAIVRSRRICSLPLSASTFTPGRPRWLGVSIGRCSISGCPRSRATRTCRCTPGAFGK